METNGGRAPQTRRQSEAIRNWRPWEKSTGPRTPEAKPRSSQNRFAGAMHPLLRKLARVLTDLDRVRDRPGKRSAERSRLRPLSGNLNYGNRPSAALGSHDDPSLGQVDGSGERGNLFALLSRLRFAASGARLNRMREERRTVDPLAAAGRLRRLFAHMHLKQSTRRLRQIGLATSVGNSYKLHGPTITYRPVNGVTT